MQTETESRIMNRYMTSVSSCINNNKTPNHLAASWALGAARTAAPGRGRAAQRQEDLRQNSTASSSPVQRDTHLLQASRRFLEGLSGNQEAI